LVNSAGLLIASREWSLDFRESLDTRRA
jgi:hypothetical protein